MTSKDADFFISTALGHEALLAEELQSTWGYLLGEDLRPNTAPPPQVKMEKGGVEVSCSLSLGLQLSWHLKTANRILLRVHHFFADEFFQFEREIKKTVPNLRAFLGSTSGLHLEVEAKRCKLGQEKRLSSILERELAFLQGPSLQGIFVRGFENHWTLSLDTSGERLHKRGLYPHKGEAPLRENLAAGLWRVLQRDFKDSLEDAWLLDPYMGSGTLLWEGLNAPLGSRSWSFETWSKLPKLFSLKNLKQQLEVPILREGFCRRLSLCEKFIGIEQDEKTFSQAQKNLENINRELDLQPGPKMELFQGKWQDVVPKIRFSQRLVILTNPPYGMRLKEEAQGLLKLAKMTKAPLVAFIFPERQDTGTWSQEGYKLEHKSRFFHGGIWVRFYVYVKG